MYKLVELKANVLKEVKESFKDTPETQFKTLAFEISTLNIGSLVKHINSTMKCYWSSRRGDREILGFEVVKAFRHKHNLTEIEELIEENNELDFLGGMSFSPLNKKSKEWKGLGNFLFFLPLLVIERKDKNYQLKINLNKSIFNNPVEQMNTLLRIESSLTFILKNFSAPQINGPRFIPTQTEWINRVENAVKSIRKNQMEKVVLSRKCLFDSAERISPLWVWEGLREVPNEGFQFFLQWEPNKAFISLSPERLFLKDKKRLLVDALAGTRPIGSTNKEEIKYQEELTSDKKELNEHKLVVDSIIETLNPYANTIERPKHVGVLKLRHVQHLHTPMEIKLKKQVNLEDLFSELHPTPAVGGRPWAKAFKFIESNEEFDRGLYASPIGHISHDRVEMAVGIRSALIENQNLHLYGGAGIVEGSIGESEWKETQNKMKNFNTVLSF